MSSRRKLIIDILFALLLGGCFIYFLYGCAPRGSLLGDDSTSRVHGGPADLIAHIAIVVSGMASLALIACGIALFFVPNKLAVAKFALAAFATLLSAGLLYWLAQHWAIAMGLSGAVLVAGLVGAAWLHRKDIEKRTGIDLDRDGKVG